MNWKNVKNANYITAVSPNKEKRNTDINKDGTTKGKKLEAAKGTSRILESYKKQKNIIDEKIAPFNETKKMEAVVGLEETNIIIQNKSNQLKEMKQNLKNKTDKDKENICISVKKRTHTMNNASNSNKTNNITSSTNNQHKKLVKDVVYNELNSSLEKEQDLTCTNRYRTMTMQKVHTEHNSNNQIIDVNNNLLTQMKSKDNLKLGIETGTKSSKNRETSLKERKPYLLNILMKNPLITDESVNPNTATTTKMKNEITKTNLNKPVITPSNKEYPDGVVTPKKAKFSMLNNLNKLTEEFYKSKEDSEFFDYEDDKKEELSSDEKLIYGNREPKDYKKIKLLGKGGCGIVWLCQDAYGKEYAVKQISKKMKSDSNRDPNNINIIIARREIDILNCLNNKINEEEDNHMIKLIDYIEDNSDLWLIFEKGGRSLSKLTFKIKGEFLGNERIYSIKKGKFLVHLFEDINNLKWFLRKMLKFIGFLNENDIVHCDIKPENILVDYYYENTQESNDKSVQDKIIFDNLKIIDFGSSFYINNPENFSSNTPEYMSPEITELMEKNTSAKEMTTFLKNLRQWPWCMDIWSLGVTILEIALSCPLWMNYKAKVIIHGKIIYKTGLFGVKGRNGSKIYSKQVEVSNSINKLMSNCLVNEENDRLLLTDLLSRMLDLNYKNRISPIEALNHPFLKE